MKRLLERWQRKIQEVQESSQIEKLASDNKIDISKFDMKQLEMGYKVEHEHKDVAKNDVDYLKIAIAHLKELPDYYTRLAKMEKDGK